MCGLDVYTPGSALGHNSMYVETYASEKLKNSSYNSKQCRSGIRPLQQKLIVEVRARLGTCFTSYVDF